MEYSCLAENICLKEAEKIYMYLDLMSKLQRKMYPPFRVGSLCSFWVRQMIYNFLQKKACYYFQLQTFYHLFGLQVAICNAIRASKYSVDAGFGGSHCARIWNSPFLGYYFTSYSLWEKLSVTFMPNMLQADLNDAGGIVI